MRLSGQSASVRRSDNDFFFPLYLKIIQFRSLGTQLAPFPGILRWFLILLFSASGLAWVVLLALDTVIFVLTLNRTISISKNSPYRLSRLIMRDGESINDRQDVIIYLSRHHVLWVSHLCLIPN